MSNPPLPPDVAALLTRLERDCRTALADQFVGLYLYGSLATGDFTPATSDVDFLVVTAEALDVAAIARLRALHEALWESGGKWAAKLEGTYLPQAALRRFVPDGPSWPTVNEGRFYVAPLGPDWVIQRHVLRTHPRAVSGPRLEAWIDPVSPAQIRAAVGDVLRGWWTDLLEQPALLQARADYQAFAVVTLCRALVALQTGEIVSKQVAAALIRHERPEWRALIDAALAWRPGEPLDRLPEVLALLRAVVALAA